MGSMTLICPMCCGETFNNSESLKYHLLSMTDNLYCPGCALRTYSVAALIQHLDTCGKDSEQEELQQKNSQTDINEDKVGPDILMDDDDDPMSDSFLATVNEEGIMIVGEGRTIQVDENGDIQVLEKGSHLQNESTSFVNVNGTDDSNDNTIKTSKISAAVQHDHSMAKKPIIINESNASEFLNSNSDSLINMSQIDDIQMYHCNILIKKESEMIPENDQEAEIMYSCSTCGLSFSSVLEHIQEYHNGQEVILEMAEQQLDEIETSTDVVVPTPVVTSPLPPNKILQTPIPTKHRQSMNTLRTEECVDSEGRLYTRKVVQIERFSDRTPVTLSSTKAPMIEKFFSNVEGVKVRDKSVTVAPTRMYRCNQCLEQFAKLVDFRVHVCLQGNNRCDQCEQTFATVKALQLHMKVHENSEFPSQKIFLCTVCGTQFLTHKSLRLHSRMHLPVKARHVDAPEGTEEETFDCSECGTTLSESYRTAHMALHTGDSITCAVCNRKFDSEESLAMHAAVHTEAANIQHGSPNAAAAAAASAAAAVAANDLVAASGQDNTQEMEFISTGMPQAMAPANTATTATQDPLEVQIQKPYQCQHCGRRFTRPHEKVKHERIHTGEKPHACEVCGKKFRVSYCLTLHMRTHTGVRPYECQHCGKRFKASSVYNHHLLTHGDERAYTCPFCPKTFKTRVQLAGHKNSHTKPFRCTECSRPFASLYAARAHIQTHRKDNNLKFSCNICGASYGRAFALKDHLKQHEGETALLLLPEPAHEEEVVQQVESFFGSEELIVPPPRGEHIIYTVPDDDE